MKIIFPKKKIYAVFPDTTTHYLTVQLRKLSYNEKYLENTSVILQIEGISISNGTILWKRKINCAYAYLDVRQWDTENAFVNAFDRETRKQKYISWVNSKYGSVSRLKPLH